LGVADFFALAEFAGAFRIVEERLYALPNMDQNGTVGRFNSFFQERWADFEYVLVDSLVVKTHQDSMRWSEPKEASAIGRSRGGLSTKIHMACDALGYPLAFILTSAERGDALQASALQRKTIHEGSA
jgi:hypothetical protein